MLNEKRSPRKPSNSARRTMKQDKDENHDYRHELF